MSIVPSATDRSPGISILVAEDNKLNVLLMAEQFRVLGIDAEIVTDGHAALARWRTGRFAAILTDIQMPGMDGYELAESIRREEGQCSRIPIIALTANASHDKKARWRTAGIDDCLDKPAELAALGAMLDRWTRPPTVAPSAPARPLKESDEREEPLDQSKLALLVGNEPSVLAEFMDAFASSLHDAIGHMSSEMARQNLAAAGSVAHQLKASAGAVGASRLARLASDMEDAATSGGNCDACWQLLLAEAGCVQAWLASRGSNLDSASARTGRP